MCKALNYFDHFLIFISAVSGCISISSFTPLIDVFVGITSSAVRIKMCGITAQIK